MFFWGWRIERTQLCNVGYLFSMCKYTYSFFVWYAYLPTQLANSGYRPVYVSVGCGERVIALWWACNGFVHEYRHVLYIGLTTDRDTGSLQYQPLPCPPPPIVLLGNVTIVCCQAWGQKAELRRGWLTLFSTEILQCTYQFPTRSTCLYSGKHSLLK